MPFGAISTSLIINYVLDFDNLFRLIRNQFIFISEIYCSHVVQKARECAVECNWLTHSVVKTELSRKLRKGTFLSVLKAEFFFISFVHFSLPRYRWLTWSQTHPASFRCQNLYKYWLSEIRTLVIRTVWISR